MLNLNFEVFEQFSLESLNSIFGVIVLVFVLWVFLFFLVLKNVKALYFFISPYFFLYTFIGMILAYAFSFLSILVMYFTSLFVVFIFYWNWNINISLSNYKIGSLISFIFLNLLEIIEKNIVKVSEFYAALLLEIGLLISLLNILGMIPFSLSLTSQLLFPLYLSLTLFIFNNLVGICCQGFYLFNLFLPSGVPLFITPLLLIIEYISYFARIFSLSIRLCANMLSVHILLKILIGFISVLIFTSLWAHFLLSLMLSIFLLDISTCFLQAYIFIFLSLIYLSNVLILH